MACKSCKSTKPARKSKTANHSGTVAAKTAGVTDSGRGETLTAGAIAKELGVSDGKVKKAIAALGIDPAAKRGPCAYYPRSALSKIKAAVE